MRKDANSTPIQIRIRLEDLSTIIEFAKTNGDTSDTASRLLSSGVKICAEMLRWNKLASKYDFNSAIDYLERLGLFSSIRVSKKAFTEQAGRVRISRLPNDVSNQEFQEILRKFKEIRDNSSECQVNDLTVPSQDDQLLAQLEEGIQTGKVPVAE